MTLLGQRPSITGQSPERCQRDYESEIESLKKRQEATQGLADSIEKYERVCGNLDALAPFFGEAILISKRLARNIEALTAEWEIEQSKGKK